MSIERDQISTPLSEKARDAIGICEITADGYPGQFVECSPAMARLTGFERTELVGMSLQKLVSPSTDYDAQIQPFRRDGATLFESSIVTRSGDDVSVELHAVRLELNGRRLAFVQARATDLQGEVNLRDSQRRLTIAKAAAKLGIHDYDVKTGLVEWDERTREIWGIEKDRQITYEFWRESLHPDDIESTESEVKRALDPKGDRSFRAEYRITNARDKSIRWVLATGQAMFVNEAPVRLVGTVEDITDRKNAEQALARSEANLRDFFDSAAVGLHWVGPDGTILRVNRAELDMLGYELDEYVGRHIAEFHADQDEIEDILQQLSSGESIQGREARMRCKDGSIRHVLIDSNVHWENGEFLHTRCFMRDITQRKQTERDLEFQKHALDQSSIVAITDVQGTITYVNDKFCEISGYSQEELIGQNHRMLNSGLHPTEFFRNMYLTISRGEVWHDEIRNRRKDGTFYWVDTTIVPAMGPDGKPERYVAIRNDITERKEAEQQIRRMNESLEQRIAERTRQLRELARQLTRAEQKERRRLAGVLHDDLQQLLVAASMRTDMLSRKLDDSELTAAAEQIRDLIQQSIDSSRSLTQELMPPILNDVGIGRTLPWLARQMKQRHDLEVELEVDEDAEPDDEELRVTLFFAAQELLFNVVKHSQVKRAKVSLAVKDEHRGRLCVQDEGVGFDPAPGSSGETSDKQVASFGLLNLRERLESLGGHVQITSKHGSGTRAEIDFPMKPVTDDDEREPSEPKSDPPWRSRPRPDSGKKDPTRVLLVDDHQMLRQGIVEILRHHADIQVVAEAADGAEAVEISLEQQPDVVIMDITMPTMNGIEATHKITQQVPETAVIGLSMHNSPDIAAKMIEAGAMRVLVKDGPANELIATIRDVVAERGIAAS